MSFHKNIESWYNQSKRSLPWRESKNPYFIWLSEVIMQQTRVAQGTKYYLHFIDKYPSVKQLADAPQEDVLKSWEGLGYYARARNLHAGAKQVVQNYKGALPTNYNELLKIKGIGPYTAAAISSICFGEKRAVVDGNVYRVLSRWRGIDTPINSTEGVKLFSQIANELIAPSKTPGNFNEGMMELGAIICTPKNPQCADCPIQKNCVARQTGQQINLPVKLKKVKIKHRYLHFFIIEKNGKIAVQRRADNDIWKGLFQFPMMEQKEPSFEKAKLIEGPIKHLLTHQRLHIYFWKTENQKIASQENTEWTDLEQLEKLAFPIVLKRFIDSNLLHLPTD